MLAKVGLQGADGRLNYERRIHRVAGVLNQVHGLSGAGRGKQVFRHFAAEFLLFRRGLGFLRIFDAAGAAAVAAAVGVSQAVDERVGFVERMICVMDMPAEVERVNGDAGDESSSSMAMPVTRAVRQWRCR